LRRGFLMPGTVAKARRAVKISTQRSRQALRLAQRATRAARRLKIFAAGAGRCRAHASVMGHGEPASRCRALADERLKAQIIMK